MRESCNKKQGKQNKPKNTTYPPTSSTELKTKSITPKQTGTGTGAGAGTETGTGKRYHATGLHLDCLDLLAQGTEQDLFSAQSVA